MQALIVWASLQIFTPRFPPLSCRHCFSYH